MLQTGLDGAQTIFLDSINNKKEKRIEQAQSKHIQLIIKRKLEEKNK